MSCRSTAAFACALVSASTAAAYAGVELGTLSPRAIGHAGAAVASDDGAAAVYQCPAAIARRDVRRAQLAGLMIDDEASFADPNHPRIGDTGGANWAPLLGAQGHLGSLIFAASFAVDATFDRSLPIPTAELPVADVLTRYPHRYAGTVARYTRRTLGAAVAWRANDWLAIGASATVGQVEIAERRTLWAGFAGRDPLAQPSRDVDLELSASDGLIQNDPATQQFVNRGALTLQGVDLSATAGKGARIEAGLAYNFVEAGSDGVGEPLDFLPRHRGQAYVATRPRR